MARLQCESTRKVRLRRIKVFITEEASEFKTTNAPQPELLLLLWFCSVLGFESNIQTQREIPYKCIDPLGGDWAAAATTVVVFRKRLEHKHKSNDESNGTEHKQVYGYKGNIIILPLKNLFSP